MPRYKVADIVFSVETFFDYTKWLCRDYEYVGEEQDEFSFKVQENDILFEKAKLPDFPDFFLESIAVYRRLCEHALNNKDGLIFHCSAIMVGGEAYLFTAPSGTGKSTHTRLWREMLGDKAVMINDDKPIIRYIDGEFFVYGTPWMGKHNLGANVRAKLKAICKIRQEKENTIENITPAEMLVTILNQTLRPEKLDNMDKLLAIIDKMLEKAKLYSLGCNISLEAAELSYKIGRASCRERVSLCV